VVSKAIYWRGDELRILEYKPLSPVWAMHMSTTEGGLIFGRIRSVANSGFLEGGFHITVVRKVRAKFQKPHPFLRKTTPILMVSGRSYQSNRPVFERIFCKKHAEVSHSSFLSCVAREGGVHFSLSLVSVQYFLVLGPAQRGVPWNPRNHPKSATDGIMV
jgi:hypothetical protein